MSGISIGWQQFLIVGIPQGFIFVIAVYIFTKTKITIKMYLLLSAIFTLATFLIRYLPISLGVNTMLSLLMIILLFQLTYKLDLRNIVKLILSVFAMSLIVVVSEIVNMLILSAIFGQKESDYLINKSPALTRSLYMIPSNVIAAAILLVSYSVISKVDNYKKVKDGEVGEKAGE